MALRMLVGSLALCLMWAQSRVTLQAADAGSDEIAQMIVKLIGDKDKEFRAAGLEQVRAAARGAASTRLFAAQLTKLDAAGQVALLNALADRGDVAALPAVLELYAASKDENVRAGTIAALGRLGGPGDLPLLIKALSTASTAEQAAARRSLTQISGETISKSLATASKSASPALKAALIDVLATRRATDQLPMFVAATLDNDPQVRKAAMAALGQIGRPVEIEPMLAGVLKAQKGAERDEAEKNVARIYARIDDEDQRGTELIAALNKVDVAQRDELLSLVGRVGGKKLIKYVVDIATGADISRRSLGIDALSKWPDASVADNLFEIATKATDSGERNQAFQAYVKIAAARDNRSDKQRLERMKQAMEAAKTPEEQALVLNRTRTAYDVESVRFVLPYVSQEPFAQVACETIVEIAHHREVRDRNKAEFDEALDKVIEISKDPVVVDRANRYKRGETWERPVKK